ncbi:MAG: cytochrome c [Saprospiraceae bacterium]|nr:cytochrome c [Lewinella sp.]
MKKLLFFAALAIFVVACGGPESGTDSESSETTASTTPAAPPPAAAPDGEKIYKTNCIACHGLYGDMGASGAFNLQESELTVDQRVEVITNGRNAMAAWGSLLKPEEIKAVAEYTMTLGKDQ